MADKTDWYHSDTQDGPEGVRKPHPTDGSGSMHSQIQSRGPFDANPGPVPRRVMPRYTHNQRLVRG